MKAVVGAGFCGNNSAAVTGQMASMELFYSEQRCLSGALSLEFALGLGWYCIKNSFCLFSYYAVVREAN